METLNFRPSSAQNRSKSLKIARFLLLAPHYQGQQSTFPTFARLQAGSTINIVANICNERRQHPTSTVATFRSTFCQMVTRLVHANCPHKLVRRVRQRHTRFQSRATYSALRLNMDRCAGWGQPDPKGHAGRAGNT